MFYVYVLINSNRETYVGYSANLKQRIIEHNKGYSKYTKTSGPWQLIFYEAFKSRKDAKRRENYFKTTNGKRALKIMIRESIK